MLGVPWVGVESWCEGGGAGTKTVRVMCTGVDDISLRRFKSFSKEGGL